MRTIPVSGPEPPPAGDEKLARQLQAAEEAAVEDAQVTEARATGSPAAAAGGPSAPPLPAEQWAAELQAPRYDEQPAAGSVDQQLEGDEALARSLYEQELRELSEEDKERLTTLPGRLAETALVRKMSETLSNLSGVSFTKLIPQVNASIAEAAEEEAPDEGRRRLEERLKLYCLVERKVKGDGNCQFRALSDQLYRTPRMHAFVRECVVLQLRRHPHLYGSYVLDSSFQHYCDEMETDGAWGDHVTLQAAADFFGLRIGVLSSFVDNFLLEIAPREQKSSRVLWLSFWAEVHYNSLYPITEAPEPLQCNDDEEDTLLGSRRLHGLVQSIRGFGNSSGGNGGGSGSGRSTVRVISLE